MEPAERILMPEPLKLCAAASLRQAARELGFPLMGITSTEKSVYLPQFNQWLDAGMNGTMAWMRERAQALANPECVLPGTRSVLMLGMPFAELERLVAESRGGVSCVDFEKRVNVDENHCKNSLQGWGIVAEYAASGFDYHDLIRRQLRPFQKVLRELFPTQSSRGIVDTAPFFEREYAERAGLGFVGRNRMLIHPKFGSFLFLAAVLTTENLEMERDADDEKGSQTFLLTREERLKYRQACDSCGRCAAACPGKALSEDGLDARKCVSALTVENRTELSEVQKRTIGTHLLGCDDCQRVCPWNRAILTNRPQTMMALAPLLKMSEEDFRKNFVHTSFWRATFEGLRRNAKICMENASRENASE